MSHHSAAEPVSFYDRTKHFARHLPHALNQPARMTAIILWLHAHDDGTDIFLSVETLMCMTGLPRRAQFRALKELIGAGYLVEDGWKTHPNGNKTRRRRLNLAKMKAVRADEIAKKGGVTGVTVPPDHSDKLGREGVTSVTVGGVTSVTQTSPSEPTIEPPQEDAPAALPAWGEIQRVRQQPLFTAPEPPTPEKPKRQSKAAANAALNVPALVETWNRICGPTMGTVQFVSDVRRKALLARMMEFFENDPAKWEAYCRKMSKSRFLTGESGKFRASFDFAVTPRNVPKVLENNYHHTPEERDAPAPSKAPYAGYNPHLRPGDPDWRPSPGTI